MKPARHIAGVRGEQLARDFLQQRGFRFLTANWWCKAGEIDLIMQDGSTRVFVEVRLRAPTTYGTGFDTVANEKQRKLIRAAQWYQQTVGFWGDVRFDVVSITDAPSGPTIDYIPNAFGV